jgi:hypothetical protein
MKRIIKKIAGAVAGTAVVAAIVMPLSGLAGIIFLASLAVAVLFGGIYMYIDYTDS